MAGGGCHPLSFFLRCTPNYEADRAEIWHSLLGILCATFFPIARLYSGRRAAPDLWHWHQRVTGVYLSGASGTVRWCFRPYSIHVMNRSVMPTAYAHMSSGVTVQCHRGDTVPGGEAPWQGTSALYAWRSIIYVWKAEVTFPSLAFQMWFQI